MVDEKFVAQHEKFRLNYEAIEKMLQFHDDYHFKPVVNPIEMPDIWEEIETFRLKMGIPKEKTWLMPPGDTRDELIRVYPMLFEFCAEHGYNLTGRSHIIAFNDQRGV